MLKEKYELVEYLPLSKIILQKPRQYQKAFLYSEHDDNDLTYFIHFNLEAIILALEDTLKHAKSTLSQRQPLHQLSKKFPQLNSRQKALLAHALKNPHAEYNFRSHQSIHQTVYQTARTDLLGLVKYGLLLHQKEGRRHLFVPSPDLRALLGRS